MFRFGRSGEFLAAVVLAELLLFTGGPARASSESILYAFVNAGIFQPIGGLIYEGGRLFGTAAYGGPFSHGAVFSLTPSGAEQTLYDFQGGTDGAQPYSGLIDVAGTLYGTTFAGGGGLGTIYTVSLNGYDSVVYAFAANITNSRIDGMQPTANMIGVGGALYGTTEFGGGTDCAGGGCGTVYVLSPGVERVIYSFKGGSSDGYEPAGGLTFLDGAFYGVTQFGGGFGSGSCPGFGGCGTAFSVTGNGQEKVLHSFANGSDAALPSGTLLNVNGTFFGVGEAGGEHGLGAIFSLTPGGVEKVIYSFRGGPDGSLPTGSLILVGSTLYGTTLKGGGTGCGGNGCGTLFSVSETGTETVIYSFKGGSDGSSPQGPLLYLNGSFYGTTLTGGGGNCESQQGCGTVFKVKP